MAAHKLAPRTTLLHHPQRAGAAVTVRTHLAHSSRGARGTPERNASPPTAGPPSRSSGHLHARHQVIREPPSRYPGTQCSSASSSSPNRLQLMHRQPRLELVRRVGMAKRMHTANLLHPGERLSSAPTVANARPGSRPGNSQRVGRCERQYAPAAPARASPSGLAHPCPAPRAQAHRRCRSEAPPLGPHP